MALLVIGESTCTESGTFKTKTSSFSWSYPTNSTTSVFCGNISRTTWTLSFSSISSGNGSYNLKTAEYGNLGKFTLAI